MFDMGARIGEVWVMAAAGTGVPAVSACACGRERDDGGHLP